MDEYIIWIYEFMDLLMHQVIDLNMYDCMQVE